MFHQQKELNRSLGFKRKCLLRMLYCEQLTGTIAMTNSEFIAQFLESRGVTHVYELIGGMITFIEDAIHRNSRIKIVCMHHEQAAAFAAEGWARISGVPGVALATSGPGATNLITGIGSCYFDSIPAIFITGQVNRHEQKGDRKIRQLGFQETDIVSVVRSITKGAWKIEDPESLPEILEEAYALALSGRPGPVLVDIPMDVQRHVLSEGKCEVCYPSRHRMETQGGNLVPFLEKLRETLSRSSRPIILAGGGIRCSRTDEKFISFVEMLSVPTVTSLMGIDAIPYDHEFRAGLIGSYGNRWSNLALGKSDWLLVLGSRLDIRQTGSNIDSFSEGKTIFHVDCDGGELNNRVTGCEAMEIDLNTFFEAAEKSIERGCGRRIPWLNEITRLRNEWPDCSELSKAVGLNPNKIMHLLSRKAEFARAYITDVGQHQMWAAQSIEVKREQRFITSGGMGAMGFGLPAAIGASIAAGPVICIVGDGGVQLNLQELETIAHNHLPVKLVIINNKCYGMVRQFQESYMKQRYQSTIWGYSAPNFVEVARAYGIGAYSVIDHESVAKGIDLLVADPMQPFVLEILVDTMTNTYPKLAFGKKFGEMEPASTPIEIEGT